MSQQWLYPIFCMYGYRPTKFETDERCLRLHLEPQPHRVCCSQCGSREVIRRGEQVRAAAQLAGGRHRELAGPQDSAGPVPGLRRGAAVRLGLADPRRSYTRAFERYVLELSQR